MVFPLFRVEFDRPGKCAGQGIFQGLAQSKKTEIGVEDVGLPAKFAGRMAIGIGDQGETVQGRDEPVHVRVRRQAGFQGKDVWAEIAVTFFNAVKAGSGTEQGKPRSPDVGRNQKTIRCFFKHDFKEIAGIKTHYGTAVGGNVAESGQDAVDPFSRGKIGNIEEVVDLAHRAVTFVNAADFGAEQKADRESNG